MKHIPWSLCTSPRPEGGIYRQRVRFGNYASSKLAPTIARAARLATSKGVRVAVCQRITGARGALLFDYMTDTASRFR